MKKITTWMPDTCACVLKVEWDDETDENARTNVFAGTDPCVIHEGLGPRGAWDAVWEECPRKNIAIMMAQAFVAGTQAEDVGWSFDAERRVHLTLVGLTGQQRNQIRAAADLQFGPGRVVVG